ncbi:MAG: hypothetical protein LAN84_14815 [Acidobacteriia bacterium]|nr:hypothetical protein [Terriglobia bacterium]
MKRTFANLCAASVLLLAGLAGSAPAQTPANVTVRLVESLSSESNKAGDSFTATLTEPLLMGDRVVAPKGARVSGKITEAVSSGRLSRPALLTLSLTQVQSGRGQYPLETGDLTVKHDGHAKRNVIIIGGSAGAGAAIGGIAGGGKGAGIGALAGAGAGTLGALLTGKQEITLPSETVLTFRVRSVQVSPKELARLQRAAPQSDTAGRNNDADPEENARPSVEHRRPQRDDYYDDDSRAGMERRRHRHGDVDEDEDGDHDRDGRNADIVFTNHDRRILVDWFSTHESNLPPGLAKRDRLPPGLEKQLRERGTLPPGLQKRVQPLPDELERRLTRLPRGYRRVSLGAHVILMNEETSVIVDIVRDVIR